MKPKKKLGQHFLIQPEIAQNIVAALTLHRDYKHVLEIGPGMGILTGFLLEDSRFFTHLIEIDPRAAAYLQSHFSLQPEQILCADFLSVAPDYLLDKPTALIGNLPYNISSQIFFKILAFRKQIPEAVCMVQKEVADRLAASPGSRAGGVLTILLQTFYDVKYLFTVPPSAFNPPPKVNSAVISLKRNDRTALPCTFKELRKVVKASFGQRRKMLKNALKSLFPNANMNDKIFLKRAEQLSVKDFIALTVYLKRNTHNQE